MRKYGTTTERSEVEVDQPGETRRTASNPDWSPEDERGLQTESED